MVHPHHSVLLCVLLVVTTKLVVGSPTAHALVGHFGDQSFDGKAGVSFCGSHTRTLRPGETVYFSNAKHRSPAKMMDDINQVEGELRVKIKNSQRGWQWVIGASQHRLQTLKPVAVHNNNNNKDNTDMGKSTMEEVWQSYHRINKSSDANHGTNKGSGGKNGGLPLLYSGYFKPPSTTLDKKHLDLFDLLVQGGDKGGGGGDEVRKRSRKKRSRSQDSATSCSWKFAGKREGKGCSHLVTHLSRGSTVDMSCDKERLVLTTTTSTTYCGKSARLQKTTTHPGHTTLQLRHEKDGGTGQLLEGYVLCSP